MKLVRDSINQLDPQDHKVDIYKKLIEADDHEECQQMRMLNTNSVAYSFQNDSS